MVWQYLSEQIKDDEAIAPGAKSSNRSNRFQVANQINALLSTDSKMAGPFRCASPDAAYPYIPQMEAGIEEEEVEACLRGLNATIGFAGKTIGFPVAKKINRLVHRPLSEG